MRFHVLAHFGDGALRRDAEDLRNQERGGGADQGGGSGRQRQSREQLPMLLGDDVVHQILRRRREHQVGEAADDHQHQADRKTTPVGPHQRPRFRPGTGGHSLFGFWKVGH